MGLAGRKQKQRIPADPRNLSWADDASRFGRAYLSKFGWDASQGLGSSGDGIKTHLKVQQKLDMMGIGAQHQRDPNGIAWKQNREYEALLKRLNECAEQEKGAKGEEREMEMFVSAQEENVEEELNDESFATIGKKRKHKDLEDPDARKNARKKRKEKKEKHQRSPPDVSAPATSPNSDAPSVPSSPNPHSEPISKPRPMAHRARIRAAKRITGKSASSISEILGIAPSSSVSTSMPTRAPTPSSSSSPAPQSSSLSLDNLTTSVKSVADYFKEKLLSRSTASSAPSSFTLSGSATPGLGAGSSNIFPPDDEDDLPRRGIGSQVPIVPPPSQVLESGDGDGNVDGQDTLPEKTRRKAERKAEKRKRREAEANQPISENVSTSAKKRVEGADAESETAQRTSKKEEKMKEHQKREQQAHAGEQSNANDDITTKKSHEHDSPVSLSEPNKKSKKAHQKNYS